MNSKAVNSLNESQATNVTSKDPEICVSRGNPSKQNVDRLGALLGSLCAVHCALTPLAIAVLPATGLGSLWTSTGEMSLVLIASLFSAPSILFLSRQITQTPQDQHRPLLLTLLIFLISWGGLCAGMIDFDTSAHAMSHDNQHDHQLYDIVLSTLGGIGLAIAHYRCLQIRQRVVCHPRKECCH